MTGRGRAMGGVVLGRVWARAGGSSALVTSPARLKMKEKHDYSSGWKQSVLF